jgi:UDP-2,3-diacylglucosamine pyrophosphatase LpxH
MKNRITFFLIIVVSLLTTLIIQIQSAPSLNVKLAVFSDSHYFAPEYVTKGPAFTNYLAHDRKLLMESDAILCKTIESVKNTDARIVLITGDLTKDGERLSHLQVAAYLKQLKDAGKQVFVVPGNHDINNPHAMKYDGGNIIPVERVTPDQFRRIYHDYGYGDAIAQDPNSLSYVAQPLPGLRIIAIDSCSYKNNLADGTPTTKSGLSAKRLDWIKTQLRQAKTRNIMVIGMMHHGLIPHFSLQKLLFSAYVIDNWDTTASEFADLGMKAVFTGHFHAQDIVEKQFIGNHKIYDIETGSLVTYPCPYRIINLANGKMKIRTETIRNINYDTRGMPFPQYAANFLAQGIKEMIPQFLGGLLIKQGMPQNEASIAAKQLAETTFRSPWTVQDVVVDALKSHYVGDEAYDDSRCNIVSTLRTSSDIRLQLLGRIAYSLYNDTHPADNNVIFTLRL